MKLIKPSTQILSDINGKTIIQSIERAGRTCYKSEELITDESAEKFIAKLIQLGHESVLEHQSISVLFVCDRGISHELVRHRIASFSQESTRYCNYAKEKFGNELTFIQPFWLSDEQLDLVKILNEHNYMKIDRVTKLWYHSMSNSEQVYLDLLKEGWVAQEARSVLPNALKTEIVITANLREWRTIFKQRAQKVAHPQMRELMCPLLRQFQKLVPIVFDDITYDTTF